MRNNSEKCRHLTIFIFHIFYEFINYFETISIASGKRDETKENGMHSN